MPAVTRDAPAGTRRCAFAGTRSNRSCLKKDPKQRLQAIGDWGLLLDEEQAAPAKARDTKIRWIAAGVLAVALSFAPWAPWRSEKPVDRPLVRLDVDLGADVSLPAPGSSGISVVISPDGTRLVYASGTPVKLFTRRLDQPKATELPGTHGASNAFFSPDGQWVGFYSNGRVNKISVEGGAVVPVGGGITFFSGASWGEDGALFVSSYGKGLLRIPAGGGPPETIAGLSSGEGALAPPQILPGGKAILCAAIAVPPDIDTQTIEVLTLADRRRKILVRGGQSPRYLPTASGARPAMVLSSASTQ
jgi:hypothetical protein